ncbi:MAG TPA: caspase family protein [Kofleriaceae bacterium]|nr:caspase family protein [Kofleriaceae bacterium]
MTLHDAYALAIGISQYQHIPSLPEVHDAPDVAATLVDPGFGGYPEARVQTLLDGAATRAAILDALDQLAQRTRDSSTVLLYFSGHGGRVHRNGADVCYLMPVDSVAAEDAIDRTAISGVELSARLRAIPAARLTVVLDCCRASGIAEPRDAAPILSPELAPALSLLARGRGRAILAASRSDGYSFVVPGQRNGVFTRHLLDGLRGAAQGAGGVIRVCDLFHYIQQKVREDDVQCPVFKAELEENYPIALYRGGEVPSLTVPPPPDPFAYDGFISYRRADAEDRAWVETVLVPRLERAGLKLCLEHRDFRLGQPRIREMERAVTRSRYTVAVLTPSYLEGGFEDFQALISQHQDLETRVGRFLPIMRKPCRPSLGVQIMLAALDVSRESEVDAAMDRLAVGLRQAPVPTFDR